jgi:hypothetical protein
MSNTDQALNRQLGRLQDMVVQVDRSIAQVGNQVALVGQEQRETRTELGVLRDDFLAFVHRQELTANVQRAETKIGTLEGQLASKFGHHEVVRRTAIGILHEFDLGLLSESTVRAVGEQLMVQTPRYWLAPVLVALSAWADDNQDLCQRAVQAAFHRSPGRTSLFMALVLRRQGRQASAVRWLRHYLDAQDPMALDRDFAVIMESIAQGAFGPAGVAMMRERLEEWRARLVTDESIQADQVRRWRAEINNHIAGSHGQRFPALASVSPQWLVLDRALGYAEAHAALVTKYSAVLTEERVVTDRLEDAVDEILDRLVRDFDPEELPLRRALAHQQTVVSCGGDLDGAQREVTARHAALEATRDYLSIQTQSALTPMDIGVSRSTQRLAVAACHAWFAQAHEQYTMDYRRGLPQSVEATFGAAHNPMASAFQLPPWTGSFVSPAEQLERSLAEHWDRHAQPYLNSFLAGWRTKVITTAVIGAVIAIVLMFCSPVLGVLATVIGGGIIAAVLYGRWQSTLKRQSEARAAIDGAKQDSIRQLRAAGAELVDWTSTFRAADGMENQVRELIADLGRAGQAGSPYERRSVDLPNRGV